MSHVDPSDPQAGGPVASTGGTEAAPGASPPETASLEEAIPLENVASSRLGTARPTLPPPSVPPAVQPGGTWNPQRFQDIVRGGIAYSLLVILAFVVVGSFASMWWTGVSTA